MLLLKKIYYCLFPLKFFFRKLPHLNEVIFHRNSKVINSDFGGKNVIGSNCFLLDTSLGYGTYIANDSSLFRVSIGKFCSIGPNVKIGFGSHPVDFISTHPAFYSPLKQSGFTFTEKESFFNEFKTNKSGKLVSVGNNCWLGYDVAILDGITIGEGAIVAAKSLVTDDVPPYSIVGGIPAKVIKLRFDKNMIIRIQRMEKLWDLETSWYIENYKFLHEIENIDQLEEKYFEFILNHKRLK
jgi:acetyltransferase-like isoleucine patch superfamily enzyme